MFLFVTVQEKLRKYCQVEIHLRSKQSLFISPLIHRFLYWIMARAPSQVKVDTLAYAWTAAPIENQAILLLSKNTLLNVRYTVIWLHKKSQCSKLVALRQIFVSSHLVCGSFCAHRCAKFCRLPHVWARNVYNVHAKNPNIFPKFQSLLKVNWFRNDFLVSSISSKKQTKIRYVQVKTNSRLDNFLSKLSDL